MFPLGTVLLPGMALPLHVFEPRYRELMRRVIEREIEPRFGVVLIERGLEVGGGDVRVSSGTVASIVDLAASPDGRYALFTVGTERIGIHEWLPDDPYPRALVRAWPDEPAGDEETGGGPDLARTATHRLESLLTLASRLGWGRQVPEIEPGTDLTTVSYRLADAAPLGALDRLRLLEAPGATARLGLLTELLEEAETLVRFRLANEED